MIDKISALNGFSILDNVFNEFVLKYRERQLLRSINDIIENGENIEENLANKYNYKHKKIMEYIDKDLNTDYVSRTNFMIDKFVSFKPVLYRFTNYNYYDREKLFLERLLMIMQLDGIYGAILKYRTKNDFVNITHPLVLMNYLYSGIKLNQTFEYILIYPIDWEDNVFYDEKIKFDKEKYEEYKSKMLEILDGQISLAMIERSKKIKKTKEEYIFKIFKDELILCTNNEEHFENNTHMFIVPCNIICENHFAPQYIWLYLRLTNKGFFGRELISNKLVCTNLNHNFSSLTDNLVYVCNGGETPYTYKGILNMLKQNVASQYDCKGFNVGFYTFVKANIDTSKFILERFINEQYNRKNQ